MKNKKIQKEISIMSTYTITYPGLGLRPLDLVTCNPQKGFA